MQLESILLTILLCAAFVIGAELLQPDATAAALTYFGVN